jgi:hypothetical protein
MALAVCIIPAAVGSINGQSTFGVQEKINSNNNNVLNQNLEVKAAYKKKTTKKTYRSYKKVSYKSYRSYKKSYRSYKKVKAAYRYKTTYSYSSIGDCWAMSEYLYNKYSSTSQVRIVQYRTSMSSRHRSIQLNQNGAWVDFNYRGNGYNGIYSATASKPGFFVVKSN